VTAKGSDIDALVRSYSPLVFDRADLTSAGLTALVQLARAYNPARGTPFAQFAGARLRGALIDELRGLDWMSRWTRARAHQVNSCRAELSVGLSQTPTSAEVAASLGIAVRDGINAQLDPDLVAVRESRGARGSIPARRAAYYAEIAASGDLRSRLSQVDLEELLLSPAKVPPAQRVHQRRHRPGASTTTELWPPIPSEDLTVMPPVTAVGPSSRRA
jgi:hypothetical protein